MIWLVTRLVVVPLKAMAGGFKVGFWTGRFVGWRRLLLVGLGLGVGVLVAPGPGADVRARLREQLDGISGRSRGGTKVVVAKPSQVTDTVVSPQPDDPEPVRPAAAEPVPPPATFPAPLPTTSPEPVPPPATFPAPLPAAPDADPATAGAAADEPTLADAPPVDPAVVEAALVDPVDPEAEPTTS